jgi:branched-chain amino acid transport system permease protein
MPSFFDVYLLEALLNGVLLGGLFALLALGLNLIFGVIDVVWICYAELIMLGMYAMYFLYVAYHVPFPLAALVSIAGGGCLGMLLHLVVIRPLLGTAPINQLLATGGVLFFLQGAATVLFGIDFRNLGIRMPIMEVAGMYISYARLLAFGAALAGMAALFLFLSRSYTGVAIRAIAQDRQIMPLMGVDPRRIYLVTSAIGGALAALASSLLVLQYDVQPFVGLTFGPIAFLICVLGGLGNMIGGFVAAFLFAEIISIAGLYFDLEWGYVLAFGIFVVLMFARPQGLLARRS